MLTAKLPETGFVIYIFCQKKWPVLIATFKIKSYHTLERGKNKFHTHVKLLLIRAESFVPN